MFCHCFVVPSSNQCHDEQQTITNAQLGLTEVDRLRAEGADGSVTLHVTADTADSFGGATVRPLTRDSPAHISTATTAAVTFPDLKVARERDKEREREKDCVCVSVCLCVCVRTCLFHPFPLFLSPHTLTHTTCFLPIHYW